MIRTNYMISDNLKLNEWHHVKELVEKRVVYSDIFKRAGRIIINKEIIKNIPEFVLNIMQYMIPFAIEFDSIKEKNYVEYYCYSQLFDLVPFKDVKDFPTYQFGKAKIESKDQPDEFVLVMCKKSEAKKASNIIPVEPN